MPETTESEYRAESRLFTWLAFAALVMTAFATWTVYAILPLIGDAWAPAILAQERGPSLSRVIDGYLSGYRNGNPRIGQFWLIFFGNFPRLHAALFAFAIPSLIIVIGAHIVGHDYRARFAQVVGSGFVGLAVFWFIDREIGATMYYQATSGNYLFALLLLLMFLLPYRYIVSQAQAGLERARMASPILRYGLFGAWLVTAFLAGLGHETFGPTVIVGLLILFAVARLLKFRFKIWMGLGWLSFTLGYAALVFSPGQDKRYTENRLDAVNVGLEVLIDRALNLTGMYFGVGIWLVGLALVIAAARFVAHRLSGIHILIFAGFLLLGLGISLTGIGAPDGIIAERFVFAAHACLAIAISGWVIGGRVGWHFLSPVLLGAVIYLGVEFANTKSAYDDYNTQFNAQRAAVEAAKAQGLSEAVVPAYTLPFYNLKKYIFKEFPQTGPNPKVNAFIARYYGLDALSVRPSDATVTFSKRLVDRPMHVSFANCPRNDAKSWKGTEDPLGGFICEDDYLAYYDSAEKLWVVSGFAEQAGASPNRKFAIKRSDTDHPETGQVRLWGGRFSFMPNGAIVTAKGDLHGYFKESRVIAAIDKGPLKLVFDPCPDDAGVQDKFDWSGQDDPFGIFICGQTYKVTWTQETLAWSISGLFEGPRGGPRTQTRTIIGQSPYEGRLNLLGGLYTFNAKGEVLSNVGERVGQIMLPDAIKEDM